MCTVSGRLHKVKVSFDRQRVVRIVNQTRYLQRQWFIETDSSRLASLEQQPERENSRKARITRVTSWFRIMKSNFRARVALWDFQWFQWIVDSKFWFRISEQTWSELLSAARLFWCIDRAKIVCSKIHKHSVCSSPAACGNDFTAENQCTDSACLPSEQLSSDHRAITQSNSPFVRL